MSEMHILQVEAERMTRQGIKDLLECRAENVVICMMDEIERLGWGKGDE